MDKDQESIELTCAIKKELDNRLDRFHKGMDVFYTLEEVKEMLAKKKM